MKGNFDFQEIEKAFKKIKSDRIFKRSSILERVLKYLIDQAVEGKDVKEQTIAIKLWGKNYDVEKNSSKVRVYVYNLRKKLAEYYKGPGANDPLKFHIEKGQYNLAFQDNRIEEKKETTLKTHINFRVPIKPVLIALGIIAIALVTFFGIKNNEETYLWKPYLTKNNSLCIIADKFIVSDRTSKINSHFAMYPDIISTSTFEKYEKKYPNLSIKETSFTIMTKMAPFGIHYLDQWFQKFDSNFDLELESQIQYSDYADKNIIYIGQSKYMTTSKSIFLKNSKVFKAEIDGYTYKKDNKTKHYVPNIGKVDYKEYTMVSYQKLDNGNYSLFFASNHDIGVIATLKMFTSKEKLKEFYKKIPKPDSEFNALFEVNGLKRNVMDCELIELEIIE
ncbi:helix-turn-helix domain-containing protein [Lutibacter citreus]|uniref:helix-turn-helix domain-containing protein n=1 Tax=Lutibacter citreus TaxID=2138210 RepID=UPI000DBE754F|nr:helix-turn-helix domain-containing protein [Lutibacter citreus]